MQTRPSASESSPPSRKVHTAVLLHEYRRTTLALSEFQSHATEVVAAAKFDRRRGLAAYDAYARFVQHLYEFYKACFRTDERDSELKLAARFQREAERLMENRADRVARGDGASWDNTEAFYRQPVPEDFGRDLGEVRNQVAHAALERTNSLARVTLATFYPRYHRFVMLLYEEAYWLWHAQDERGTDWGEIGRFEAALKGGSSGSP